MLMLLLIIFILLVLTFLYAACKRSGELSREEERMEIENEEIN